MKLIDQLKNEIASMSDAEREELKALLNGQQKEKPTQNMTRMDGLKRHPDGSPYTDEEMYDLQNPIRHKAYTYHETTYVDGKQHVHGYRREEIDAMNAEIDEAWLAEKRKYFPDAQLPKDQNGSTGKSGRSDG